MQDLKCNNERAKKINRHFEEEITFPKLYFETLQIDTK